MAGQLKEVRNRIRSIQNTQQITKAMKMVSAAKLRRAQDHIIQMRPYAQKLQELLSNIVSNSEGELGMALAVERPAEKVLFIVITSDRGLAGAYNANVLREASRLRQRNTDDGVKTLNYVAGRKGIGWHRFRDLEMVEQWFGFSAQPTYADAERLATAVLDAFEQDTKDGGVDEIYLVSTEFISMLTQRPVVRRLLPMEIEEREGERPGGPLPSYEFEPSTDVVLDALLPQYVASRIYYAMLEAAASELAARRRAMKAATDNANDLIERLTREANNARQAEITQEISEIVGGSNALAEANAGSE